MAQNASTWWWTNGVWFVAWRMAGWTFIAGGDDGVDEEVLVKPFCVSEAATSEQHFFLVMLRE